MNNLEYLRPYCERLVKADPERFELTQDAFLNFTSNAAGFSFHESVSKAWGTFGPLAEELRIPAITSRYTKPPRMLLEALASAVNEGFEAKVVKDV